MADVTIDAVELIEIRFTVTEDDLTYMGTYSYPVEELPDQETVENQIATDFAAWKQVIRPEGA